MRSGQEEKKAEMPIDQVRNRNSGLSVLEQRIKALEEGTTASLARIEQALIAIQAAKTEKREIYESCPLANVRSPFRQ